MIKRYDIVNLDGFGIDTEQATAGDWVKYDDIKNLIPDNRVMVKDFHLWLNKHWYFKWHNGQNKCFIELNDLYDYAKQKVWIKPEGDI